MIGRRAVTEQIVLDAWMLIDLREQRARENEDSRARILAPGLGGNDGKTEGQEDKR